MQASNNKSLVNKKLLKTLFLNSLIIEKYVITS